MTSPSGTAANLAGGIEVVVSVLGVAATAVAFVRISGVVYRRA